MTAPELKYGRRNVAKMIREWDALRQAIRAEGTPMVQSALDQVEEHIDYAYRTDLAAVQPAQVRDLISRMDAIQACQVGPSDEWSKATKSGYEQAATDCQRNILRIKPAALEPQPDPSDEVIKGLVEAADECRQALKDYMKQYPHMVKGYLVDAEQHARAALAAAKAVHHG